MTPTLKSRSAGFTLVEMLIYMGLFSIFIVIATNIFITTLETKLESQATASVEQDSRYVLSRLSYDIGQSSAVTTPAIGSQSASLVLTINGQTHTYSLSNGNLQVVNPSGTFQLNSSDTSVSQLSFLRLANPAVVGTDDNIKVSATYQSRTVRQGGQPETRTLDFTAGRR